MNYVFQTLRLKAKHQVHTLLSGYSLSKKQAEGYDFSQLRAYQAGDDIRKINWQITAKLQTPYVNEHHTQRTLHVVVASLMDSSFVFGADSPTSPSKKQAYLSQVALLLGYVTQSHGDMFTGLGYTQNKHYSTPPTKQAYFIERFAEQLYESKLLTSTLNIQTSIQNLFSRISRPSLLFVLGDFLSFTDLSVLAQKHEVIAIGIRDEAEEVPTKLGEVLLKNPYNTQTLETYFSSKNIHSYLKELQQHDLHQQAHFHKYSIRYLKIKTNEDIIERLGTLFK